MKGFGDLIREKGYGRTVRYLFYPLSGLLTNPYYAALSFFYSLRVLDLRKRYTHFSFRSAINIYFYFTRALNLSWYGRSGKTPYLGLGDYELARCFYYTKFSLIPFYRYPALTVWVSMMVWLISHVLWLDTQVPGLLVFSVIGLAWISSTFFNNLLMQNYNAVGWAFFPMMLWALYAGNLYVFGFSLLLVSFGSFTLAIISFLFLPIVLWEYGFPYVLAYAPTAIKLLIQALPLARSENGKQMLGGILKAIGSNRSKAKYVRAQNYRLNAHFVYYLFIYFQFGIALWVFEGRYQFYFYALGIFMLNKLFVRFMDDQNGRMLLSSIALFTFLSTPEVWLLPSLWLVLNPIPILAGMDVFKNRIDRLVTIKPIQTTELEEKCAGFLDPIREGEKGLFAWSDPQDVYEKVFDGYRNLYEVLLYAATVKKAILRPDWWTVFELNYEGAPDFWGREPNEVRHKMQEWDLAYTIIYQVDAPELDPKWESAGFIEENRLDWGFLESALEDYSKLPYSNLSWFLLRKS